MMALMIFGGYLSLAGGVTILTGNFMASCMIALGVQLIVLGANLK